ncbi:hypothetical protein ACHQM5_024233 [Ranunculus cassubicifolius]
MASTKSSDIEFEYSPFLRVYKDGRKERLKFTDYLPPSTDPSTGVTSKQITIQPSTGVSIRFYLPKDTTPAKKIPLLIYFHGGGWTLETAYSPTYHHYLNSVAAVANVVAISVDYRRPPDCDLPIAYQDSWTVLEWIANHGKEEDDWLKNYVDFDRVFLAGDSAGADISHNMGVQAGVEGLSGMKIHGIVLVHPYLCGSEKLESEIGSDFVENLGKLWIYCCSNPIGLDDPYINPMKNPNFAKLGCEKVLVCVAGEDDLRDRGKLYCHELGKSGWKGVVEFMVSEGSAHVFHLDNPSSEKAKELMKRIVSFVNSA